MINKNIKEKIFNVILFILIFVAILSTILLKPINELDELWNYNFARNIANGLIPYKDFNMVVTPLLSIVCGIILKLTFNELIVMRILAALLCSAIMYTTYRLFRILNIKKEISIIFTFLILFLFKNIYAIDYNYASLLLTVIIIYLEIKFYQKDLKIVKEDLKQDLLLGILGGTAIIVKQTSGLFICLALLGNKLLFINNKEELKIYFKSFIFRLLGIVLPVGLFLIYLFVNNTFEDFISYAILGVTEFTNSISYRVLMKFNIVGLLSILVPITFIYIWIRSVFIDTNKNEYILSVHGLAIFTICFPISNKIHFLIGALPIIIIIFYEIYCIFTNYILKNIKVNQLVLVIFKYIFICLLICYSALNIYKYINMKEDYTQLNHFKFIPKSYMFDEMQTNISEYIKQNDNVKILDGLAVMFTIPADKYNKDYDMFNKGNLGLDGENRIIQEIANSKGTKYLILKEGYELKWQTPLDIINFVTNTKTKTGEIEIFYIYE